MGFSVLLLLMVFILLFIVFPVVHAYFKENIKKREDQTGKSFRFNMLEAALNAFFTTLVICVVFLVFLWELMEEVVFM